MMSPSMVVCESFEEMILPRARTSLELHHLYGPCHPYSQALWPSTLTLLIHMLSMAGARI